MTGGRHYFEQVRSILKSAGLRMRHSRGGILQLVIESHK